MSKSKGFDAETIKASRIDSLEGVNLRTLVDEAIEAGKKGRVAVEYVLASPDLAVIVRRDVSSLVIRAEQRAELELLRGGEYDDQDDDEDTYTSLDGPSGRGTKGTWQQQNNVVALKSHLATQGFTLSNNHWIAWVDATAEQHRERELHWTKARNMQAAWASAHKIAADTIIANKVKHLKDLSKKKLEAALEAIGIDDDGRPIVEKHVAVSIKRNRRSAR